MSSLNILLFLHLFASTTGYVVLVPPQNYTVFENNTPAIFNCTGDGYSVGWYLNGSAYNAVHVQRGIIVVPATPTGGVVSSSLSIPSKSINNNTEVFCKVIDATFTYIQQSAPANLTIQGPLDAPYNFSVVMSNTSFNISWGAPFSLHVKGYPDIFNYTLCTNIAIYGCKTIPSEPDCTFPRTCTSSVDFTDPSLNGTNKTIMEYGDTIKFTFYAINGAGNGTTTEYIYHINDTDTRIQESPMTTETVIRNVFAMLFPSNSTSNSTSHLSIGAVSLGLISGAVVVIVIIIIITVIIVAIRCSIMKRKAQFEHNELIPVHADSSHADGCNYYSTQRTQVEDPYFIPVSDFRPTTSQDPDKSCIESGIQHQSNQEQLQCKGESSYADVLCVPVISISAPKEEVTYSDVRNTEAAQSVPVTQPSEQISSTPPPKYDNVVLPAESNKLEQTEPPKHMNEAQSVPVTQPSEQISSTPPPKYDNVVSPAESNKLEQAEPPKHMNEVEEGVEDSIKDIPKVEDRVKDSIKDMPQGEKETTCKDAEKGLQASDNKSQRIECDCDGDDDAPSFPVAQPSEQISSTSPLNYDNVVLPVGVNKVEERVKDSIKDTPKAYSIPSSKGGSRTVCDGDDENIEEEIKDLDTNNTPKAYLPSGNKSQHLRRIECDGQDENVEEEIKDVEKDDIPKVQEETKDLVKEDIQAYSNPSTKISRIECDEDDDDVSSSASHDSSQCQQCTEWGEDEDDGNDWCQSSTTENQATVPQQFTSGVLVKTGCDDSKQITIISNIKDDESLKCEHVEGQTFTTSKEANVTDDASSNDEGRPHTFNPDDMPVPSSIVPTCSKEVYSNPSNDRNCTVYDRDDENDWCKNPISENQATVPQQVTSGVLVETDSVPQQCTCDDTGSCVLPTINLQVKNEHIEGHKTLPTSKESNISNDASSDDVGRIMEQGDMWNITIRTEIKFGAAGVGKTHLQHSPMNDPPEQCFSTDIKDMFSSLEEDCFLFQNDKELIENAMVSCYLKIINEKEVKDQAKTWKTYVQDVKANSALDVQALYAKGIVHMWNKETFVYNH